MPSHYVPTKSSSDTFSSLDYMRYIRENFRQGAPHIFTAKGDVASGAEVRQAASLSAGNDYELLTADSTSPGGVSYYPAIGIVVDRIVSYVPEHEDVKYSFPWGASNNVSTVANVRDPYGFLDGDSVNENIKIPAGLGGIYAVSYFEGIDNTDAEWDATLGVEGSVKMEYTCHVPNASDGYPIVYYYEVLMSFVRQLNAGDTLRFYYKQHDFDAGSALYGGFSGYGHLSMIRLR